MSAFVRTFFHREGLTLGQNIIYRNFNILLGVALLDIMIILLSLQSLEPRWPFWLCLSEFVCLVIFIILHLRGHLMVARFGAFLIALIVQATACMIHGRTAGFDYIFYALAVLPMLFFEKPAHYVPLFAVSIGTMLAVQYAYSFREPLLIIPGEFIFYWNIFFTAALVLLVMYIFKSGYMSALRKNWSNSTTSWRIRRKRSR